MNFWAGYLVGWSVFDSVHDLILISGSTEILVLMRCMDSWLLWLQVNDVQMLLEDKFGIIRAFYLSTDSFHIFQLLSMAQLEPVVWLYQVLVATPSITPATFMILYPCYSICVSKSWTRMKCASFGCMKQRGIWLCK